MHGMDKETFIEHLDALAENYGYESESLPTADEVLSGIRTVDSSEETILVFNLIRECCEKIKELYDKIGKANIRTDEQMINLLKGISESNDELIIFALKTTMAFMEIQVGHHFLMSQEWLHFCKDYGHLVPDSRNL